MSAHEALANAVRITGGQTAFGEKLGVTQSLVWYWLNRSKKGVAPEYVQPIENLTGIPRAELRPDLFAEERSRA